MFEPETAAVPSSPVKRSRPGPAGAPFDHSSRCAPAGITATPAPAGHWRPSTFSRVNEFPPGARTVTLHGLSTPLSKTVAAPAKALGTWAMSAAPIVPAEYRATRPAPRPAAATARSNSAPVIARVG